jgi:hypothetical protein
MKSFPGSPEAWVWLSCRLPLLGDVLFSLVSRPRDDISGESSCGEGVTGDGLVGEVDQEKK